MNLRVKLGDPAETALMRLAIRERRDPRHQAEVLIIDGLRQRGVMDLESEVIPFSEPMEVSQS